MRKKKKKSEQIKTGGRIYTKSLHKDTFGSGKNLCYPSCVVNLCLKEDSFTYAIRVKQGVGTVLKNSC